MINTILGVQYILGERYNI